MQFVVIPIMVDLNRFNDNENNKEEKKRVHNKADDIKSSNAASLTNNDIIEHKVFKSDVQDSGRSIDGSAASLTNLLVRVRTGQSEFVSEDPAVRTENIINESPSPGVITDFSLI